jgi:tetratricopeptide (TPR) repeat protein
LFNYYIHENNLSKSNSLINENMIKDVQKIIKKHKKIFSKYPNIYSKILKKIGTYYMLKNNHQLASKYFIKSIKVNPLSRIYINLILSFSPKLYKKILFFKKKLKN